MSKGLNKPCLSQ